MHYPNPLHDDERWAEESRFEAIVAPQSFTVATDTSHGCSPAQVGKIPNSHLIFGGDDWWFFGPRIWPGDHLRSEEHTSELQSLMRISYAVFCLKKKKNKRKTSSK